MPEGKLNLTREEIKMYKTEQQEKCDNQNEKDFEMEKAREKAEYMRSLDIEIGKEFAKGFLNAVLKGRRKIEAIETIEFLYPPEFRD